jgi:hypothetical protein
MKGNGKKVKNMVMESVLILYRKYSMKENFKMVNIMDLELSKNKINFIKAHLKRVINKVSEFRNSKMVTCIKDNMKKDISMERESIYGQMEMYFKVTLFKELDLVQVNGCLLMKKIMGIFIMEVIKMIRKTV